MNNIEANKKNIAYFNNFYKDYNPEKIKQDNWLWTFDKIIADAKNPVVDLGCGDGANTLYLLNKGKKVVPCDGAKNAIFNIRNNVPEVKESIYFDMLNIFPFPNSSIDLMIADLCLHYFTKEDTINILKEVRRVLTNRGHMLLRVNSLSGMNPLDNGMEEVEHHLYMTEDGRYKRFFDYKDMYDIFNIFNIKYIREDSTNKYGFTKKLYIANVENLK